MIYCEVWMSFSQRPRECDTSRYRHGCDPPKRVKAPPSDRNNLHSPIFPPSTPSLIRLVQLQPSLLASSSEFHRQSSSCSMPPLVSRVSRCVNASQLIAWCWN